MPPTTSSTPFLALLGAACLINLAISVLVWRSRFYSPAQKLLQCLLVWLVPILGPVGIWAFLRAQHRWETYDTRAYPEPSEKMVVIEIDGTITDSVSAGSNGSGD
jgi:hypothetical protein